MTKAGLHAQCSCLLLPKPGLITTGWEPDLWKKSKAVADHKLNVFEAGYGTIKKSWKTLSPVLLVTRKASASIVVLFWVDL